MDAREVSGVDLDLNCDDTHAAELLVARDRR